jgi:LuxR family transcriptional regulator, maltose regulon positive regulatory protein
VSQVAAAKRLQSLRADASPHPLEGAALRTAESVHDPSSRAVAVSVVRPRLVRRLAAARASIALVAAPAGYGKTTLLAEWDTADRRPFAWVTADRSHNESGALVAAIEQALDDSAPAKARGRTRARRSSGTVALARLTQSLERRPPFVLVLDDLQALQAEGSLEAVRTLARHVPAHSVLTLGTRSEPALPIGRLRANRALTEIRPQDLAMTTREATALLALAGVTLADADLAALVQKAEGWPAGLYLASLALTGQADPAAAVARFGGDDAIVANYLRDEMLSALPDATVSFLIRTSVLDRLSGPVCDFVLEQAGSAQLLRTIGSGDLLMVPLDRADDEFRCHALLAQMLRAELRRTDADTGARLHRRASDWYAERGDVDRAMHHAVEARDTARAAALLAASAPEYVSHGLNSRIERWLSTFTDEQIAAQPALVLTAANSHLLKGELDAVHRWESAARRKLHETPPAKRSAAHEASVALLHAVAGHQDVQTMGDDAARAYGLEPQDSPWRALCCLLEGVALGLTGRADAAEARLDEGVRRAAVAAPNIQTLCLAQLALLAVDRDDWDGAAVVAARALAQVDRHTLGGYPSSALVFAVSALVFARRGKVEEAKQAARNSRQLLAMLTDFMPWYDVETRLALASAYARLTDCNPARELLNDAVRLARRLPECLVVHEQIEQLEARLELVSTCLAPLTTAELRILAFLPTHLSFREIAGRLHVSANTVKTQAHAVYRKIDAASRSEAVTNASRLGLLDF